MNTLLLKNAKIIEKDNNLKTVNVLIENGLVKSLDYQGDDLDTVIDLDGKLLMPGLVDVHVHLREPGFTEKETIKTGTQAAARGGFTHICAMPNLNPVPDTKEKYDAILDIIKKDALVKVDHYAPITKSLTSDEIVDMKSINAFSYTNDGVGVQTAGTMYKAMKEVAKLNKPLTAHTEDNSLLFGGVMHEGIRNKELGLKGILSATESSQIARDVILAYETKVHYHVCHVSSKESVAAIKMGKAIGANVTSEVSPHHLLLNEMDIPGNDGAYKMNPPLRSKEDQEALIKALIEGDIEIIATDHAPHTKEEKANGFDGPFGIIGLESAFPLLYTHFVKAKGLFTLENLQTWMSIKPKTLFNLEGNFMKEGDAADFAVYDLEKEVIMDEAFFHSKSQNTPFKNQKVYGACVLTIVDGNIVYQEAI